MTKRCSSVRSYYLPPLLAAVVASLLPGSAWGGMILSGDIELISPPASVVAGALESNDFARIFVERQSFVLGSNLEVDFVASGTYDATTDLPSAAPIISAGTVLDSYFIDADVVGDSVLQKYDGSVTFDTEIVGVILTNKIASPSKLLSASDAILGHPGTIYPPANDTSRDVELGSGGTFDQLILSADRKTLSFHLATENSADQLRIVTAPDSITATPEPSSLTLMLLGLLGVAGMRGRAPAAEFWKRRNSGTSPR